ncbi:MAG: AAA family ATPase, partial [Synergistaceae bacterium]|nr:AAA family ATPase [Synergistaceae bacterium]
MTKIMLLKSSAGFLSGFTTKFYRNLTENFKLIMKILDIRLKNLNSLKGEWHIDLTGNAFADGIFAVTGPTGAGKTTIFDAVCLALYGMTPRLGKISGQNNEIMSRGTSECYAQVAFETDKGRFTARWSQTRSGKRGKGKLQTYNHKLDAEDKPLTSGIKETADKIAELTGMNFKQFSQAMMLQQGGFDAFLNADKKERAQVLESVTGIEIYGEISQRVFQRSKDEAIALKEIESKLEDKQKYILDSDKLNSELNENTARINKLETELKDIKAAKDWLSDIAKRENDLEQNKIKIKAQQKRLDEFKLNREKLERAESAVSIEAHYTELKSERAAFKTSQDLCEKILNNINQCKKKLFDINGKKLPELQKFLRDEMHGLDLQEHPDVIKAKIFAAISKFDNAYKDKQKLSGECKDTESKLKQARADLQKILKARGSARNEMDEALSESRKISDEIINFRARTAEAVLAEERIKLKAGDPCPLCGSLEHPAARHLKTSSDKAAELFKTTEMLEKKFKQAQRNYEEAKNKFDELDKKYNAVSDSERTLSGALEKIKSDMQGKSDELDACHD